MSETQTKQSLENLGRALSRLKEALNVPIDNPLYIDGTVQRFEFAIELYWKTLKRMLQDEGITLSTPRETLKQGFQIGWLGDEEVWLGMLRDRNETSHVYDEHTAETIYQHIRTYYPVMERTYDSLVERFERG
jgi:nucleotidyltransferase substrate binding protein (TIGR01987 family)